MTADDLRRGAIDEVPIVDAIGRPEIQLENRIAFFDVAPFVLIDENHQRQQPLLMPFRLQEVP